MEAKYNAARLFVTDFRQLLVPVLYVPELRDIVHGYYFSQLDFETAIYTITCGQDLPMIKPVADLLANDDSLFIQQWNKQALDHLASSHTSTFWDVVSRTGKLGWCLKWPLASDYTRCARIWCFYGQCRCGHPLKNPRRV